MVQPRKLILAATITRSDSIDAVVKAVFARQPTLVCLEYAEPHSAPWFNSHIYKIAKTLADRGIKVAPLFDGNTIIEYDAVGIALAFRGLSAPVSEQLRQIKTRFSAGLTILSAQDVGHALELAESLPGMVRVYQRALELCDSLTEERISAEWDRLKLVLLRDVNTRISEVRPDLVLITDFIDALAIHNSNRQLFSFEHLEL